jgi:hypothetical protein
MNMKNDETQTRTFEDRGMVWKGGGEPPLPRFNRWILIRQNPELLLQINICIKSFT